MRQPRILIIDTYAEHILDFCLRCQDAGWSVKWFSDPSQARGVNVGKGLVERVPEYQPWMRWADVVLTTDNTKYISQLDKWREEGVRIVGPTLETAAWEIDRKVGMKVFEDVGIPCAPYREFTDYDAAIAYVKKKDTAYVSKPCGAVTDKSLSYVAPSPEALVYMLESWKKRGKQKPSFILQEKIKGIEFAVGGWFGPHGWNKGFEENWEFKKLFDGDTGPNTGEQGTVMRFVRQSKLANKVLKPLTEKLLAAGYIGNVDINCIIDDLGGVWPLEHTMRLGVPAFQIQQSLTDGDPAQWLVDLCDGIDSQPIVYDQMAVGIVMAIPPYPNGRGTDEEVIGIPIYGITDKNRDSIHPSMIMEAETWVNDGGIKKAPGWVTAGDYVLCATGVDTYVNKARDKALAVLDDLKDTPASPFWRRQIGNRLKQQLPKLQAMGYATGAQYSESSDAT